MSSSCNRRLDCVVELPAYSEEEDEEDKSFAVVAGGVVAESMEQVASGVELVEPLVGYRVSQLVTPSAHYY